MVNMKRDIAVLIVGQFALLVLQMIVLNVSDPAVLTSNLPLFFFAFICADIADTIQCLVAEHYEVVDWPTIGIMAAELTAFTIFKASSLALFPPPRIELRLTFLYFGIAHEVLCYGAALGWARRLPRCNDELCLYILLQMSYLCAAIAAAQLAGVAPQDMAWLFGAVIAVSLAHVPWLMALLIRLALRRSQLAP